MNRKEKYPDTDTFSYFNANPKNKITGDCVARAICTALELPYNQVVMELAEQQCKTGYCGTCKEGFDLYLKSKGWVKHKQPRKADNTKFTGKDFCKAHPEGRFVAKIGAHHIVAIVDGKVNDIWNSTSRCIGNYWTHE